MKVCMLNDMASLTDWSTDWSPEEIKICKKYNGHCVKCGKEAITLHEIVPKSRLPKAWMQIGNQIPLCLKCHAWAHRVSCKVSAPILIECRDNFHA
jgi:hypothetical protein